MGPKFERGANFPKEGPFKKFKVTNGHTPLGVLIRPHQDDGTKN